MTHTFDKEPGKKKNTTFHMGLALKLDKQHEH